MLTRRHFVVTSAALFSTPIASAAFGEPSAIESLQEPVAAAPVSPPSMWARWDAQVTPANYNPATTNPWGLDTRFLPTRVQANDGLTPGDIHVDAVARYLYHIQNDGTALRFGVAIARGNLYEPGTYTIRWKTRWPTWRPTEDMVTRDPGAYAQFKDGVNGGPKNPLGSRALYLFVGNRDTYLRIHGTPQPRSIGGRASSGCVRMVMAHINGLYGQVRPGATAVLYPPEGSVSAKS